mgnify:CR=1 FL=1
MPCGSLAVDFFLIVGLCGAVGGMAMYLVADKLKRKKIDGNFPRRENWYRKEGYQ